MTKITITHPTINSGNPLRILGQNVTITYKRNVNSDTNENEDLTEVQTRHVDNPKLTISNVKLNQSGFFDISHINALIKLKYGGSIIAPILNVEYAGDKDLVLLGGSKDIKVVLETATPILDVGTSRESSVPRCSLTFTETK